MGVQSQPQIATGCQLLYGAAMATADEKVGANLRLFRERAGIRQAELARRMTEAGHPWQQSTVARAESGSQPLRAGELETLARMLGVPVDRFFWLEGEAAEQEFAERAIARLREAAEEAVLSVMRLQAARSSAESASQGAAGSAHERVREMAGIIRGELRDATLKRVLAEAAARLEKEQDG